MDIDPVANPTETRWYLERAAVPDVSQRAKQGFIKNSEYRCLVVHASLRQPCDARSISFVELRHV